MKITNLVYVFLSLVLLVLISCKRMPITQTTDIVYNKVHGLQLNVFQPKKMSEKHPVLVFIHGGNWNAGKKSTYNFFGKGMARKGIVTVIIDYRLSNSTTYEGMATDAAQAVQWVKDSISAYGGDPEKIFLSGHSAGAHLAALIACDNRYFDSLKITNPVNGTILIDAFGLNMFKYLKNSTNKKDAIYFPAFTQNPEKWKDGSPAHHLDKKMPPFLVFVGGKTYPAIASGTNDFMTLLNPYQPAASLIYVKGKRHAGMILQFYNSHNKAYLEILNFIRSIK